MTRTKQKPATIQDVARTAQVSTATVSRVLTQPKVVSEATRTSVLEAIRLTGYRVNRAARTLRTQRAGAVLILIPNLGKPFYSGILAGISEGFAGTDTSILISDTEVNPVEETTLADYFLDGLIDGAILLDGRMSPPVLSRCADAGMGGRTVFLCEWVEGDWGPVIAADNALGARLAIRHLHDLGHRNIAHVTGPAGNVLTAARREGVMAERARLGLPARDDWIIRGDFSLESGREAADRIFAMEDRPTAVFCAADMVAFGLIARLNACGLSVPGDISVIGFDDIEMSGHFVPALTTIRQDRRRLGLRAAEVLRDLLSGADEQPTEPLHPVELVIRNSTAAP